MTGSSRVAEPDLLVLHAVRCAGYSSRARIADVAGIEEAQAESELIDLAVQGLVTYVPEVGAWGLTDAGRAADGERIARELESTAARDAVTSAYERFLVLNPELLDLCTLWQLRTVDGVNVANDHSDQRYDARVLDRFAALDERAAGVCEQLSAALPRFARYRTRLRESLDRASAGELDYVADGTSSYHAVWAQLHEDLLATLGIPRW